MKPLAVGLLTVALVGGSIAAALGVRGCHARELHAYEEGRRAGLVEGMRTASPCPASECVAEAPLPPEVLALASCSAALADYRRTEAANRVNARLLGWNDGYAQGREDWRVQPWECPAR